MQRVRPMQGTTQWTDGILVRPYQKHPTARTIPAIMGPRRRASTPYRGEYLLRVQRSRIPYTD